MKFRIVSWVISLTFLLFLPSQNYYSTLQFEFQPPLVRASELGEIKMAPYPQKIGPEEAPIISAKSAIVVDLESQVTLFTKNSREHLALASITKLMTALVSLDYYQPDEVITVRRLAPANGEAEMGLGVGDRVNVSNLLYGLLVPSGNDAAYALADNYPGGIENFVYAMNKKASNLHMVDSHFVNPSGLDALGHFSSARDIALLASQALRNKTISKIVTTYGITLTDVTGQKVYLLKNVNQFLGYLYGADGVKTGFTDLAGECLVASVTRDGHRLVTVALNSQDRFVDSARLIEWGFRNYDWVNIQ